MCRRIRQLVMPGYLSAACSSLVLGALMMFALAGCVAKNETDDTSRADAVPEHESWYGVFQGSAKTGFATTQRRRIEEHGESLVEIRKTLVIQGPKGNDVPQARFEMTFVETPNGDLRRFIRTAATGGKTPRPLAASRAAFWKSKIRWRAIETSPGRRIFAARMRGSESSLKTRRRWMKPAGFERSTIRFSRSFHRS